MANFGKKPKKPGSVPGAASGGKEQRVKSQARGFAARVVRELKYGRQARNSRSGR
jgi:hypothetical protein